MKVIQGGSGIVYGVELTRRNLLILLSKLDRSDSAKTIMTIMTGGSFFVRAVEDDAHYADRTPGPMHPDDEAKAAQ